MVAGEVVFGICRDVVDFYGRVVRYGVVFVCAGVAGRRVERAIRQVEDDGVGQGERNDNAKTLVDGDVPVVSCLKKERDFLAFGQGGIVFGGEGTVRFFRDVVIKRQGCRGVTDGEAVDFCISVGEIGQGCSRTQDTKGHENERRDDDSEFLIHDSPVSTLRLILKEYDSSLRSYVYSQFSSFLPKCSAETSKPGEGFPLRG